MNKAEQAVEMLQGLNEIEEAKYAKILQEKVGPELVDIFEQYCQHLVSEEQQDENVVKTLVHLMITGYLVHANETEPMVPSPPEPA